MTGRHGSDGGTSIAFIVIAYNARPTIRRCVSSILSQPVQKRVIVVDNASTDGTVLALDGLPVTILFEPRRLRGTARNRGLEAAEGGHVAFVDADVELPDGWAERALRLLDEHPDAAAVGGPGRTPDASWVARALDALQYGHGPHDAPAYVDSLATMDVLYRAECIRGRRFADLWAAEDPEFNFRLVEAGHRLLWSRDLCVTHHHSSTLGELLGKAYRYGMWLLAPYWGHPRRLTPGILFRVAYLPAAVAATALVPAHPAALATLAIWLLLPFLAYGYSALRQAAALGAGGAARFTLVHGLRQHAQMAVIWVGLLNGTWRSFDRRREAGT